MVYNINEKVIKTFYIKLRTSIEPLMVRVIKS